jgi:hypothetical protein
MCLEILKENVSYVITSFFYNLIGLSFSGSETDMDIMHQICQNNKMRNLCTWLVRIADLQHNPVRGPGIWLSEFHTGRIIFLRQP